MLATLYYNKSRLMLERGKTEEALKVAAKGSDILNRYFAAEHVNHGDTYFLLGDIMLTEGKVREAEPYYRKAEKIYELTYKESHWKRQSIIEKLKLIKAVQLNKYKA
jgi:tetratricopeptide (TPR) repeat protein